MYLMHSPLEEWTAEYVRSMAAHDESANVEKKSAAKMERVRLTHTHIQRWPLPHGGHWASLSRPVHVPVQEDEHLDTVLRYVAQHAPCHTRPDPKSHELESFRLLLVLLIAFHDE